jgi:hypothetical protein
LVDNRAKTNKENKNMINRTILILLLTVATAFSATAAPVTGKAKIASLPQEDQITLATTPEQNMRHTRRLAFKKRFAQARKDKIKIPAYEINHKL